jgi:hypothetical protein
MKYEHLLRYNEFIQTWSTSILEWRHFFNYKNSFWKKLGFSECFWRFLFSYFIISYHSEFLLFFLAILSAFSLWVFESREKKEICFRNLLPNFTNCATWLERLGKAVQKGGIGKITLGILLVLCLHPPSPPFLRMVILTMFDSAIKMKISLLISLSSSTLPSLFNFISLLPSSASSHVVIRTSPVLLWLWIPPSYS